MKIFVVNAAQTFGHSGGELNNALTKADKEFFEAIPKSEIRITNICKGYDVDTEVENLIWADVVIYHTPVWWMGVPFGFKEYIDRVFTAGRGKIYANDGRILPNPKEGYGTGGILTNTKYMLTTTWNAPFEAFTLPGEFFMERGVDQGVMFGFHRMNAFVGMKPLTSYHFYDVMKDPDTENFVSNYKVHLQKIFMD